MSCGDESTFNRLLGVQLADNDRLPVPAQHRPKPSSMVPFQRDGAFVGREDVLEKIREKFEQAASQDHSRVALVGLGGVG
jgi:hypothetical protein